MYSNTHLVATCNFVCVCVCVYLCVCVCVCVCAELHDSMISKSQNMKLLCILSEFLVLFRLP